MRQRFFSANSINTLYLKLIKELSTNPEYDVTPRGMRIKELLNTTIELTNPLDCLVTFTHRKLNYAFSVVEKLEYISGQTNPERMIFYNSTYKNWLNKLNYFDGSYPDRLQYWYIHIYNLLKKDRDTRQAVMTIYGPQDRHLSSDIACTCLHQFLIRDDKLFMTTYMRSQDLLWGFPYDVAGFCFQQEAMASFLDIEMGTYTLHVGSEHLYVNREKQLLDLLKTSTITDDITNPKLGRPVDFYDFRGNLNLFWFLEEHMRKNIMSVEKLMIMKQELFPALEKYFDILWAYKKGKDEQIKYKDVVRNKFKKMLN